MSAPCLTSLDPPWSFERNPLEGRASILARRSSGLNAVHAADRNGTRKPGGYTHLEEYLHSID